ncbi:MAG: RelA/SpoT domain-containing protein [Chloroflexi bacterium]|nr:RelA/SpoT domain-containing protein [Chloroflexota bacterium]MCY3939394.1 RelA/SpoT domain-containing protein [Chloroflexota bacterium]
MQTYLRSKSKQFDQRSLVSQRIKRLSSIESKLCRIPSLKLTQMQDIGGCRSVVGNLRHVDELVDVYHRSRIKHELIRENDYIANPKPCGYRSHHLVYRYYSDKNDIYTGLRIEIQIRSRLQHAWATAVETVGTFTQQALKSSQGERKWLRFFQLMSTVLALQENRPGTPSTPDNRTDLIAELKYYTSELDVINRLRTYRVVAQMYPMLKDVRYFLLHVDSENEQTIVKGFRSNELNVASNEYLEAEQKLRGTHSGDTVLVSVESLESLRHAYPNYFLDTSRFLEEVELAVSDNSI